MCSAGNKQHVNVPRWLMQLLDAITTAPDRCLPLAAPSQPDKYTSRRLPLPLPAVRWHPKYDGKFDEIGQIPPSVRQVAAPAMAGPGGQGSAQVLATA